MLHLFVFPFWLLAKYNNPIFEKAGLHYDKEAVYTLTTNLRGRIRRAHELERPILSMNKAEAEAG